MTKDAAFRLASADAKRYESFIYIVWSEEEDDAPGEHYHYGSGEALDRFFPGAKALACFGPDGVQFSTS